MKYKVIGKTYENKEKIRELGYTWNRDASRWQSDTYISLPIENVELVFSLESTEDMDQLKKDIEQYKKDYIEFILEKDFQYYFERNYTREKVLENNKDAFNGNFRIFLQNHIFPDRFLLRERFGSDIGGRIEECKKIEALVEEFVNTQYLYE